MLENLEDRRLFAAGALDLSFSNDGFANLHFGGGYQVTAADVAVQADGKTVVVGLAQRESDGHRHFAVARFNGDGTPDTTFGPGHNGTVITPIGGLHEADARTVAIASDGKIIVGGTAEVHDTIGFDDQEFAIVRYNSDGSLDTTFDGDGKQTVEFGSVAAITDIAIQGDGKIVVVGNSLDFTSSTMGVARFNTNGSVDLSFDQQGVKRLSGTGRPRAKAVAIDYNGSPSTNPDYGRIIVAGFQRPSDPQAVFYRINPSGRLDTSFGGVGNVRHTLPGHRSLDANSLVVQPNGKIVFAGTGEGKHFTLGRLNANGSLDTSFGPEQNGFVETTFAMDSFGDAMISNNEGSLIVAGRMVQTGPGFAVAIAKYNSEGIADTTFGSGGMVTPPLAIVSGGVGLARGPGRRFTVAGGSGFSTARYLDNGANVVAAGSFNPTAYEAGQRVSGFTVARLERLPSPTRVYFSIGGTARGPNVRIPINLDYTVSGMTVPNPLLGTPYVDIPANQLLTTVTLTPIDDTLGEGLETAVFSIIPNASYELGTPAGTSIDIIDNDVVGATLNATADAYVKDGTDAGKNFGGATELLAKNTPTAGLNRQIYLKFDLTNLGTFNNAKLRLYGGLNNNNEPGVALSVFGASDTSWSESAINFNNKPAINGPASPASTTISGTTKQFYDWNITAYLQQQRALGKTSVTLVIRSNAKTDPFARFNSREAGNGPQIVLT